MADALSSTSTSSALTSIYDLLSTDDRTSIDEAMSNSSDYSTPGGPMYGVFHGWRRDYIATPYEWDPNNKYDCGIDCTLLTSPSTGVRLVIRNYAAKFDDLSDHSFVGGMELHYCTIVGIGKEFQFPSPCEQFNRKGEGGVIDQLQNFRIFLRCEIISYAHEELYAKTQFGGIRCRVAPFMYRLVSPSPGDSASEEPFVRRCTLDDAIPSNELKPGATIILYGEPALVNVFVTDPTYLPKLKGIRIASGLLGDQQYDTRSEDDDQENKEDGEVYVAAQP